MYFTLKDNKTPKNVLLAILIKLIAWLSLFNIPFPNKMVLGLLNHILTNNFKIFHLN